MINKYKNIDFKDLANRLMFDISEQEEKIIEKDFEVFVNQLELFNKIDEKYDLNKVEEMIYPFEEEFEFLRDDEIENNKSTEDVLKNANDTKYMQVAVKKVIK